MAWLENRWSERFQSKINVSVQREERNIGSMRESSTNVSPLAGITYRIRRKNTGTSRKEIRNDLSSTIYRSSSYYLDTGYNSYTNTFAVDYFPASVLILRLRLVTTYKDRRDFGGDVVTVNVNVRMTAQF